ncbi:MAG: hypothetical protein RR482_03230 [Clostridia bacterium]
MTFRIDFHALLQTLPTMLYGMAGIFVVMLAIYGVIGLFSIVKTKEKPE